MLLKTSLAACRQQRDNSRIGAAAKLLVFAGVLMTPPLARAGFTAQVRVASGINQPIAVAQAPGNPDHLFVVDKKGKIEIVDLLTGVVNPTPFLTIPDVNYSVNEAGLLGFAFDPNYQTNGKFYVDMTADNSGDVIIEGETSPFDTVIREYTVSANPSVANPTPKTVMKIHQPRSWHNGGWIGFGPHDGNLYIAMGDGGLARSVDPLVNALGGILRIDVRGDDFADPERNYAIPDDNPYVNGPGVDEIWAYGLRNPWRNGFDRATGDLWIGDVGHEIYEEIDFLSANSAGGVNFGWPLREGPIQFPGPEGGPLPPGAVDPVYAYLHGTGLNDPDPFKGFTVVGGYVYRGPDPTLRGKYIFADTYPAKYFMLDPADPYGTVENITAQLPPDTGQTLFVSSFGEDLAGNLYVVYIASGEVYRLVTDTLTPGDFNADGSVNAADLPRWRTNAGTTAGADFGEGDADGDGDVDGSDFLIWQRHVGVNPLAISTTAAAGNGQPTPEPAAWALWVVTVAAAGMARRGRWVT